MDKLTASAHPLFLPSVEKQAEPEPDQTGYVINKDQNYWGSSIFSGHQDVKKSATAKAQDLGRPGCYMTDMELPHHSFNTMRQTTRCGLTLH
jgi:hypothetical protein